MDAAFNASLVLESIKLLCYLVADYAREELFRIRNNRTKNIAPSNSFSADLERTYILALIL